MKTITIRLPDVEAAMLVEVQKKRQNLRSLENTLTELIRREYSRLKQPLRVWRWQLIANSCYAGFLS